MVNTDTCVSGWPLLSRTSAEMSCKLLVSGTNTKQDCGCVPFWGHEPLPIGEIPEGSDKESPEKKNNSQFCPSGLPEASNVATTESSIMSLNNPPSDNKTAVV